MDSLYEQTRIILRDIWRQRWLALGLAWGICLLGWLIVWLVPSSYESKAKLLVQPQALLQGQIGPTDRQAELNQARQMLLADENLQKIVRETDLARTVTTSAEMAARTATLRRNIEIVQGLDNIVEITAKSNFSGLSEGQNARAAPAIAQGLIDLTTEEGLADSRANAQNNLTFLDGQLKRLEGQLQDAERRRAEFDAQFLGSLPGEGSIAQRLSAARAEMANIDRDLIAAQTSLAALRGQMGALPATIPGFGGDAPGPASAQLGQLEAQLSQARARGWTDSHPDVISLTGQIARVRPQAQAERGRRGGGGGGQANPALISLRTMAAEKEAQASAARVRKAQIQSAIGQLTAANAASPGLVEQQAQLSRDYDVLKRQYDKLLEERENVRLRGDLASRGAALSFRVIAPPSRPNAPASPNRPLLMTAILLLGLGAGAAAGLLKSRLRSTFPTTTRLAEVTGLPVLGSVTRLVTPERRERQRFQLRRFASAGAVLAGVYGLLMLAELWQRAVAA